MPEPIDILSAGLPSEESAFERTAEMATAAGLRVVAPVPALQHHRLGKVPHETRRARQL